MFENMFMVGDTVEDIENEDLAARTKKPKSQTEPPYIPAKPRGGRYKPRLSPGLGPGGSDRPNPLRVYPGPIPKKRRMLTPRRRSV